MNKKNNEGSKIVKDAIARLMSNKDLSREESREVMTAMMKNQATDAQISAYLVALSMKGETVDEITGTAEALTEKASPMGMKFKNMVDTCGTGGDNLHTFNISTAAAFVTAGAGVAVAKHGHRFVSSKCGSADLLKAVGVNIDLSKKKAMRCLEETGITFLFAPKFNRQWRYTYNARSEIGARTIFNIMGPLTNPARTRRQLIGVYDSGLMHTLIDVMRELGAEQVMVVHGALGIDEISITGKTSIIELIDGQVFEYEITPENFNIHSATISSIQTASQEDNVRIFHEVLNGVPGPALDIVLLNAGAAIKVSGKVSSIYEGIEQARKSVKSGAARDKLQKLIKRTNAN